MKPMTYKTNPFDPEQWKKLNYSQGKIEGFDLDKYQDSHVLLVGAGAIGSLTGLSLIRKGLGYLDIYDHDFVEEKNLTRQLFSKIDIRKNKAHCLANMLSKQGFFKSTITGYPFRFQEAIENGYLKKPEVIICGVDNNPTRVGVTKYCLKNNIPLIMSAVSRNANIMYCAVQEPGKACFGCIMPHSLNDDSYPCNQPGIIDVIQVVSGFTVYALDTILMGRHCEWNIKMISLDGSFPDSSVIINKKANCPLCGKENSCETMRCISERFLE